MNCTSRHWCVIGMCLRTWILLCVWSTICKQGGKRKQCQQCKVHAGVIKGYQMDMVESAKEALFRIKPTAQHRSEIRRHRNVTHYLNHIAAAWEMERQGGGREGRKAARLARLEEQMDVESDVFMRQILGDAQSGRIAQTHGEHPLVLTAPDSRSVSMNAGKIWVLCRGYRQRCPSCDGVVKPVHVLVHGTVQHVVPRKSGACCK
jgi:hypothetical protein